jgi:hypothetical protein
VTCNATEELLATCPVELAMAFTCGGALNAISTLALPWSGRVDAERGSLLSAGTVGLSVGVWPSHPRAAARNGANKAIARTTNNWGIVRILLARNAALIAALVLLLNCDPAVTEGSSDH